MKVIHIALKDILQSFRSYIALAFMFGVPILMTGIFYILLGGMRGEDESIVLPEIPIVIVNFDQGSPNFNAAVLSEMGTEQGVPGTNLSKVKTMGDILGQFLKGEALSDLLEVSTAQDDANARAAVDRQEADVAVIIPADFTAALVEPDRTASVEVYKDPTLTLTPGIVQSIISQFVDYSSATRVGMNVIANDLQEAGLVLESAQFQEIAMQLIGAQRAAGAGQGGEGFQQVKFESFSGELVSRKTAVINLAGRKVFPEEIEAVLNRHPAVRESRVYGRQHAHLGEVVEAELVLRTPEANQESVRVFCREHLASFKVPTQWRVVNALPRTAVTGKIRRAAAVAQNG